MDLHGATELLSHRKCYVVIFRLLPIIAALLGYTVSTTCFSNGCIKEISHFVPMTCFCKHLDIKKYIAACATWQACMAGQVSLFSLFLS